MLQSWDGQGTAKLSLCELFGIILCDILGFPAPAYAVQTLDRRALTGSEGEPELQPQFLWNFYSRTNPHSTRGYVSQILPDRIIAKWLRFAQVLISSDFI